MLMRIAVVAAICGFLFGFDEGVIAGTVDPVYKFDHGVLHDADVEVGSASVKVGGYTVQLEETSPYQDMKLT